MKTQADMAREYLNRLRNFSFDGNVTTDHLAGWDNYKSILAPSHLTGKRYFDFLAGQEARKLRNKDAYTHIMANDGECGYFSKTYAGRLSHKRIIKILEKQGFLQNIQVAIVDNATGKETSRSIGY